MENERFFLSKLKLPSILIVFYSQIPLFQVDLTVHASGPANPDFVSNQIRIVSDVSNGFTVKEEDKFHIVLVNRPIENFGKLLKDESEVCVLCVHRDVDFLKDIGLMEVSRMSTGDKHFSLLYRVSVIAQFTQYYVGG